MSTHPRQIGKYLIDGVLGSGAWGLVYLATDPLIQRRVALKTIHRSLLADDEVLETITARFRNEAQAGGRLSHPGIVSVYEYGADGDTAFIAMEFVEGQDLSKVLSAHPIMSEPMLLQVMDQLLSGLHHAHGQGVWHRDIKPANLILTTTGQLKITDFGIARIRDAALTQVTSMIGTHGYMAPEQYRGQEIDHRVDVFAAGVLLYRLLTGKSPFSGTPEGIMYQVMNEDPPPPSSVSGARRAIQVDSVVAKAMAKDARDRYPTAGAFRESLRAHALLAAPGNPMIASVLHGEETVIDSEAMQALHAAAPPVPNTAGHWPPEVLAPVERALASFVGPLAKVLVKRAAEGHGDYPAFIAAVAGHLNTSEERARFLAKVNGTRGSGAGAQEGSDVRRKPGSGSGASAHERVARSSGAGASGQGHGQGSQHPPLSPAFLAHAQRVLAAQMGPLAAVVVKKAAAQAHDVEGFIDALVKSAAEAVDADRLRKDLSQGS